MTLKELFEENNIEEIKKDYRTVDYTNLDEIIGKQYWICDYRLGKDGPTNKLLRAIKPTLVHVFHNRDLPKNKTVYYSPIHFRPVKNGKILSTIIAPFDNTGYRCISGKSVNIFNTQEECLERFISQLDDILTEFNKEIERLQDNKLQFNIIRSEYIERAIKIEKP